jgi:flagellar motor component MotA
MVDTTDIEKKSLEAHVELCAERYRFLEEKLQTLEEKISGLGKTVGAVHDLVAKVAEKRNDQVIGWGVGIIAALVGTVGYLLSNFVMK